MKVEAQGDFSFYQKVLPLHVCADHTCELPPWQTEEELKSEVIWSTGLALYIQFDFSPACRAHTLCEGQSSIPAHYPINCFMAGLQWSSSTDCSAPVQLEVTQTQQVYSYMLLFWNVLASFSFFFVNLLNFFFFLPGTFLLPSHLLLSSWQVFLLAPQAAISFS